MSRNTIIALCASLALIAGAVIALRSYSTMSSALPQREEFGSRTEAYAAALKFVTSNGGTITSVLGTGSMAPYIPAAKPGQPIEDAVAFVVTDPRRDYATIRPGDLCLYKPDWFQGRLVLHQAAQFNSDGWVMSGLHNSRSESEERMTASKFIGIVVYTSVIK